MELEVLQGNLYQGLVTVGRVLASKPQLSILANVLLQADDEGLRLVASNLEATIETVVGAKVIKKGEFTVAGRTLLEIVGSIGAEKVSLEVKEGILALSAGGFRARLNGVAAAEYPAVIPEKKEAVRKLQFSAQEFIGLVEKTVFAVATDESRAALTGVLLKTSDSVLEIAATDGFRLSVVKIEKEAVKGEEKKVIIPAKTWAEVGRIVAERKEGEKERRKEVKMDLLAEGNQVYFEWGDVKIYSRLVVGNFPDFEKIIPSNFILKVAVTAEEFIRVVKLAAIFARESANIIRLKVAGQKLKVLANAPQVGENESEVEVKVEGETGEEFSIAFNYRYLLDFLGAVSGEVTMEFSGPTAPGVFRASSDADFLHLVMPVRVQS